MQAIAYRLAPDPHARRRQRVALSARQIPLAGIVLRVRIVRSVIAKILESLAARDCAEPSLARGSLLVRRRAIVFGQAPMPLETPTRPHEIEIIRLVLAHVVRANADAREVPAILGFDRLADVGFIAARFGRKGEDNL